MDFHSLSRRDLQALCKKNRIPANMTNVAMADALQALKTVEGIEEMKEALQFQSPVKEVRSPNLPRTSRRTTARRAPVPEEPKEQQGSPLPRARRVAIKASEIMKLVSEGEEEKKQGPEEAPKSPDVCTGRKPQAGPSTRRRASKKEDKSPQEEEKKEEDGTKEFPKTPTTACSTRRKESKETEGPQDPLEVPITSATRCSLRASARRGAQPPIAGEEKQEETVGLRTTRRTRQSTRKQMEETAMDAAAKVGRKTTRAKATVKMAALAQEEEQDQTDITTDDSTDQKNDPSQISDVKSDGILMMEEEEERGKQEDNVLPGLEESPIRGLVSSEPTPEINQEQKEPLDGTPEENPTVTDGGSEEECGGGENLDFALPGPSLSDEIPANIEDSDHQQLETQAAEDSPLIEENLAVELHSEIEATSDQIPDDLIKNKEGDGNNLEKTKVFGDKLPENLVPDTETDGPDDGVEIPEVIRESSAGKLIANQTVPETESVLKHAISSPPQQSSSSDATRSPSKTLIVGEDQIENPADSAAGLPAKTLARTVARLGDPAGEPVAPDHVCYETHSNETIPEIEEGEKRAAEESVLTDIYMAERVGGDDSKENGMDSNVPSGFSMVEVGGGEGELKSKAEKPSQPNYSNLSLRKLKALVREKATNLNNKVEGKRAAFTELDDNRI